jgi:hypothetical protein
MPETWYITREGKQHGPITDREFRKLVELGHLKATDYVWHDGAADWMPAVQVLDPAPSIARPRPPRPEAPDEGTSPVPDDGPGLTGKRRVLIVGGGVLLAVLAAAAAMFAIYRALDGAFRSGSDPSRSTVAFHCNAGGEGSDPTCPEAATRGS